MQKFMFNQMFDEEIIERQRQEEAERLEAERIAEENAPPTFTVEEMEAAKLVAHQQGMQEGKVEAMASIEQQANLTLDLVLRQIGDLLTQYKNWTQEVHHVSISMAVAIMRKLAPELLRGSELPQVEHIVNEAFQFLTDQPKVMIRVASDLEAPLSEKVHLMASRVGYEGQVVLTGDPELELTDCRISWHAGAVERSLDETWMLIDEMFDRVLRGLPARDHPEPIPVEDETETGDEETEGEDDAEASGAAESKGEETDGAAEAATEESTETAARADDGADPIVTETEIGAADLSDATPDASLEAPTEQGDAEILAPQSNTREIDQPEARRALASEE